MQEKLYISGLPFRTWLWQSKDSRITLLASIGVILIQFFIFKLLFPYPNFLPDSYSYIEAAVKQQHINLWPIGYSRFLWAFGFLTHSHKLLVWLQYLLLQAAILYFLYTIAYFLNPGKCLLRILLLAALCNPLTYQVGNFISSDALFAMLSLCWFTQIIWILYKPTLSLLFLHALMLLFVFSVRYNALYYPFISLAVLLLAKIPRQNKIVGITAICLLSGSFIGYTQEHYYQETGSVQFSAFGGWQLASNALFAYAHVPSDKRAGVDRFRKLQGIVDRHMDSLQSLPQRPDMQLGIYYLWNEQSPLKRYMYQRWMKDSTANGFKRWALMGPEYKEYGKCLIKKYPTAFLQFYLWPNLIYYYVPKTEFLAAYNMGKDTLDKDGVNWFRLKSNKVYSLVSRSAMQINEYLSILLAITNLLFLVGLAGFIWLKGFAESNGTVNQIVRWLLVVWCCNMGFSVIASPIVLRYQVFPMLITQTFMLWLLSFFIRNSRTAIKPLIVCQK